MGDLVSDPDFMGSVHPLMNGTWTLTEYLEHIKKVDEQALKIIDANSTAFSDFIRNRPQKKSDWDKGNVWQKGPHAQKILRKAARIAGGPDHEGMNVDKWEEIIAWIADRDVEDTLARVHGRWATVCINWILERIFLLANDTAYVVNFR